jgi:F0F1-type ATP synthase membrane subunit c/vacuolar-type H+-ATPase subunit K
MAEPLVSTTNGGSHRATTDPTFLTDALVARAVSAMGAIIEAKVDGQRAVFETRLGAMDTAIGLVRTVADQLPTRMDEKVQHLKDLTDVKFGGIDTQFKERDVRTEQTRASDKTAVDAALQAQKESAGKQADAFGEATQKSEDQFTKQIDLQGELLRTEVKGLVTQISELKDRINRGEGVGQGQTAAQTTARAALTTAQGSTGNSLSFTAIVISVAFGLIGLVIAGITLATVLSRPMAAAVAP